jgi:hypothetical protein
MTKELANCGDNAIATLQTKNNSIETVGIEGFYQVECRDKNGNLKWAEKFPNLVNAVGKELMLDTLLAGSSYSVTGPFLGLIGTTSPTFGTGSDTNSSHAGWTEFVNYTVGGSAVRGTAVFGAATSSGSTPANITVAAASSITYAITGAGGNVTGCFLVLGSGASATLSNTGGVLYSAGAFAVPKTTTSGDTVSVTYSTTATS